MGCGFAQCRTNGYPRSPFTYEEILFKLGLAFAYNSLKPNTESFFWTVYVYISQWMKYWYITLLRNWDDRRHSGFPVCLHLKNGNRELIILISAPALTCNNWCNIDQSLLIGIAYDIWGEPLRIYVHVKVMFIVFQTQQHMNDFQVFSPILNVETIVIYVDSNR